MKINLFTIKWTLVALLFVGAVTACGNSAKEKETASSTTEQEAKTASFMEVDDVLKQAASLTGKEVKLQGVCTHICAHGGGKIFVMGSDDTQTLRIEAGELGSFDKKCVNSIVKINGILQEERIDEEYLQKMEEAAKNEAEKEHGEQGEGCESSKAARGETANTTAGRIADFRKKIEDRKAKDGKAYLSFYYVIAKKYEIE